MMRAVFVPVMRSIKVHYGVCYALLQVLRVVQSVRWLASWDGPVLVGSPARLSPSFERLLSQLQVRLGVLCQFRACRRASARPHAVFGAWARG